MHRNTDSSPTTRVVLDLVPDEDRGDGPAVTVLYRVLDWIEDGEWLGSWCAALRYERGATGLELVDLRVYSLHEETAVGRVEPIRALPSPVPDPATGEPLGVVRLTRTTAAFPGSNHRPDLARPPGGITSRLLRQIPWAVIEKNARAALPLAGAAEPMQFTGWSELELGKRTGRRGRPPRDYALLAHRYIVLCEEGVQSPVADLARETHQAVATVRDQLHEARRRGLLTSAGRGRAGGSLTPEAIALLTDAETG